MADKISRVVAVEAERDGGVAARAGKPVSDCPYQRTADPSVEDFQAHHWLKGYARASAQ